MAEQHSTYPVTIRWRSGDVSIAGAPDGPPEIEVAPPPQFGGPGGRWTPEHLFVAAAGACWMSTFLGMAEASRLEVAEASVSAEGFLERGDDRRYSIPRLVLRPRVGVHREQDRERALRLAHKAEQACLVTRSMSAHVELEPEVAVVASV
jgi:organic hydroperoxide reductase OsmC/OhrA